MSDVFVLLNSLLLSCYGSPRQVLDIEILVTPHSSTPVFRSEISKWSAV